MSRLVVDNSARKPRRKANIGPPSPWPLALLASLVVGLWFAAFGNLPGLPPLSLPGLGGETVTARFSTCVNGAGYTCLIDGDTIIYRGERIRVSDINTPETYRASCAYEQSLGDRAKQRMLQLINAGPFEIVRTGLRDRDVYDRKLRELHRNGQSLGMILVSEGLAEPWTGRRRDWCG